MNPTGLNCIGSMSDDMGGRGDDVRTPKNSEKNSFEDLKKRRYYNDYDDPIPSDQVTNIVSPIEPEKDDSWWDTIIKAAEKVYDWFTEPVDPDNPYAQYIQRQQRVIDKLNRGERITADDFEELTADDLELISPFIAGVSLSQGTLTIAGSRSIPPEFVDRVERIAAALKRNGCKITTGCATGVDEVFAKHAERIFAIFDDTGKGAISASNVNGVKEAAERGAEIVYNSGGPLSVPVVARLVERSKKTATASDTILGIFTNEISKGTTNELKTAAKAGKNVFAMAISGITLPVLKKGGHWEPVPNSKGIWEGLHQWVDTAGLF